MGGVKINSITKYENSIKMILVDKAEGDIIAHRGQRCTFLRKAIFVTPLCCFTAVGPVCTFCRHVLSKPQPQPNLNTTVGFDMKMTLQTPPTHLTHQRNFSGTSRRARELKFGTDTH